jgi:hypothetical protein
LLGPSSMGITFELNPRWERTLPSFGNFAWDIHRVPPNLRCRIPPRHLDLIKARVILFGRTSGTRRITTSFHWLEVWANKTILTPRWDGMLHFVAYCTFKDFCNY